MSDVQKQAGMDWMEATLDRLGQDQGSALNTLGWDADTVDVQGSRHHFALSLNGHREILTFNDAELEDLPDDPTLRMQVEGAVRAFLNDALRGSPFCRSEAVAALQHSTIPTPLPA